MHALLAIYSLDSFATAHYNGRRNEIIHYAHQVRTMKDYISPDFTQALSSAARITENDAAELLRASGCVSHRYHHATRKEPTKLTNNVTSAVPDKLWTPSYVFDIGVNFLVYCVHFLLMLWSTAYAIKTWDASISLAGLASGLFIVGALFARIPAGRFIDFVGRRHMFLAGTGAYFLLVLLYLVAPTLSTFMIVRFLHGLAFGTTSTAASTVVAALVPLKRMGTGIGYFTLGVTLASAAGPFVAMNLTQAGAFTLGIEICTALTFVIFLLSFFIKVPERVILPHEREDIKKISFDRFFSLKALGISTIGLMGGVCYSTVLSFLGAYTNAIGVTGIGATCFFLCFAATSFISRPLTGFLLDSRGGNVVIYPALGCMAIAMAIIANAASDIPLLIGALFLGFGYGTITASCHALAVHCAPMHQVGIATSTYFVLLDLGIGVGPYTLGSFVPTFGFSFVYIAAGVLAVAGMGLYYYLLARHHRFTRHQMDRDSEAKTIVAERRARFFERAAAQN